MAGEAVTYVGASIDQAPIPSPFLFSRQLKTPHPPDSTSTIFILPHHDPRPGSNLTFAHASMWTMSVRHRAHLLQKRGRALMMLMAAPAG